MFDAVNITTNDQVTLQLEVFGADSANTLIVNPAIGVKRKLYHAFAASMAAQGLTVVLYNYRGMEDGMDVLADDALQNAESWGRLDQSAIIGWVRTSLKPEKVWVLGHSIGGQLLGFAHNIDHIDGLILVAAQKGDKRLWPLSGYMKLYLLWHVLVPWMSKGPRFNAAKLGLGNYPWPSAAAKQWASWGQQKDYLFNQKFGFDLNPWHHFAKPLLCFGFTDDDMAPEAAIDGLLEEYGKSLTVNDDQRHIEKRIIDPQNLGLESIGHFGFFKPEAKSLWQDTVKWIRQH